MGSSVVRSDYIIAMFNKSSGQSSIVMPSALPPFLDMYESMLVVMPDIFTSGIKSCSNSLTMKVISVRLALYVAV